MRRQDPDYMAKRKAYRNTSKYKKVQEKARRRYKKKHGHWGVGPRGSWKAWCNGVAYRWEFTPQELMELVERQGYRCALTGQQLTPGTANADHIYPKSRGGDNTLHNCQVVTRDVNQMKRCMTNSELFRLCEMILKYNA